MSLLLAREGCWTTPLSPPQTLKRGEHLLHTAVRSVLPWTGSTLRSCSHCQQLGTPCQVWQLLLPVQPLAQLSCCSAAGICSQSALVIHCHDSLLCKFTVSTFAHFQLRVLIAKFFLAAHVAFPYFLRVPATLAVTARMQPAGLTAASRGRPSTLCCRFDHAELISSLCLCCFYRVLAGRRAARRSRPSTR